MALDPKRYSIAWIAPLPIEARAALCLLDRKHDGRFAMERGDDYVFQAGDVCGHNVVIATLPAGQPYGTGSAAALAAQVKKYFPNLWFGLLVGVAAGLPRLTGPLPRDIRLGDVLVALPDGDSAGLIAYDLGKETEDGFQLLRGGHVLAATETVVRSAIGNIRLQAPDDLDLFIPYYNKIKDMEHSGGTFADPGQHADRIYSTDDANASAVLPRLPRSEDRRTRIWYGPIGSGDKLLKNEARRNELRDRYNVIGLEMEAAGTTVSIPVGVIRGVCDYGDKHKNKEWQPYAAAMAAAYAKAILAQIGPRGLRNVCPIPFKRNLNFTGREAQLDQLERMLFSEGRERVALAGLGGMGKTQIALELAYRVKEAPADGSFEQRSVLWMPAQSLPAFHRAAVNVVRKLELPLSDHDDGKEALRKYLESEASGPWLLILDNLDDTAVLDGVPGHSAGLVNFLPSNRAGRLLVTTRISRIAVRVAGSDVLQLDAMSVNEAHELLKTLLIDKTQVNDVERTKELLEKLTYLPLTVGQAAYYMNQERMPVVEYLRLLESADANMISLLRERLNDETHYSETQGAVATTWMVSFDAICRNNVGALRLLSFIRWIDFKAIPRSILPSHGSDMDLAASIGVICGYGFMSWQEDGQTLDMHRLVHLTLRYWSEQSQEGVMSQTTVVDHLSEIFPSDDWENRHVWRQYLPHVLPLIKSASSTRDEGIASLGHRAGLCLDVDGRITETVEVLELAATIRKEILPESHPNRLASLHELAYAYSKNGQVKEAVKLLEHVVTIQKEILAESHQSRLSSQHELASAYKADGQVTEAIKLLEHVVTIEKETLLESHPNRLTSQHELARAYLANKQVTEAIELLEHVVTIRKETLLESHPDRLASQHELASAYKADGQVTEAIELLEHVVSIQKETFAESHPNQLTSQHELARAYAVNGQVKQAIKLLEHVVSIRKEILSESHPDRLGSEKLLAEYKSQGRRNEQRMRRTGLRTWFRRWKLRYCAWP